MVGNISNSVLFYVKHIGWIAFGVCVSGGLPAYPLFQAQASQSLVCPTNQIQSRSAYPKQHQFVQMVTGCGKTDVLTLDDSDQWISVRGRAPFELSRAADMLEVTVLAPDTYGVFGCGQKLVYKWARTYGIVLDSSSAKGDGSEQPAQKPPQ
jgi:hypothetical protein